MSIKVNNKDAYLDTVERMEPDIHMIDLGGFYASAAISLKRIADSLNFFQLLAHHSLEFVASKAPEDTTDEEISAFAAELLTKIYGK